MYRSFAIAAATIGACTLIVYAVGTSADAQPCPNPGERPAVASDPVVQNGTIAINTCYNPNTIGIGQQNEQVKQDLAKMRCGNNVNTEQLDPKFSVCADTFMQQLRQSSPTACIDSAYRSNQQQLAACMGICGQSSCPGLCAPPGKSYHQRGLAIDVNGLKISNQQFWSLALQFGIGNPSGLHGSDPHHIQAMNGGTNCASLGYTPTETDTFTPGPFNNNPYFNYGPNPLPSISSPGASTGYCLVSIEPVIYQPCNTSQNPFSNPPAPPAPQQPPQTPAITPQQCAPQFSCVNNTIYLQTTSCTQQVYQTCQYGCSGTVCLPNPASSNRSSILGTTYPVIVPSTTPATTMLQQFSQPFPAAATPAKAAVPALTSGIYNVISVEASSTQNPAQTGSTSSETLPAQQTFVSSGLSQSGYTPAPSGILPILQNLQILLTNLLGFLHSIGR